VFGLRPSGRQHIALAACVQAHRELYNAALQERRDGWSHRKTDRCLQLRVQSVSHPPVGLCRDARPARETERVGRTGFSSGCLFIW
jgi:hypothetical protein